MIDEIFAGGMSVVQVAQAIHDRNAGRTVRYYWGDPQHIYNQTQQSPKSIAQQFRETPFPIRLMGWPRTGRNEDSMVQAVRDRLIATKLKVFSSCVNTIREFQSWSFKRTSRGDIPPGEDKYADTDNHTMDVIKGVVATNPKHEGLRITISGEPHTLQQSRPH